jgi:two-component system response regulator MprA
MGMSKVTVDEPRPQILVVDDERAVREALGRALVLGGFDVALAADGKEGLGLVERDTPDVVVLDLMMPGLDGMQACQIMRARGHRTPVLMLTARADVSSRVEGLDAGADDYLIKPFALEELLARLNALIRRHRSEEPQARLEFADLVLDPAAHEVHRGDRCLELTRTEFALLRLLMQNPKRALSREVIFDRVWGYDFGGRSKGLDVYIGYLRRKTEAGGEPRLIHTVRGVGYVLREP